MVVAKATAVADPSSGQRWVFRRTEGDMFEADLYVSPGEFVREHVHPEPEGTFTGLAGTFVLEVDGEKTSIGPGDTVVIPPSTPHGFRTPARPPTFWSGFAL